MYEDPKSKISQLEKVLDAREDRVSRKIKRHELKDRDITIRQSWDDSEFKTNDESDAFENSKVNNSFSMKILFVSFVFFTIAILFVAYKFMGGGNIVSGDNIDVTVKAPVSVTGGEILPFEVQVKNNNSIALSSVYLNIAYPQGARDITDSSSPAKTGQISLGNILPGQMVKKNLSVILFGLENEKKDITLTLEYKVAGSNSLFNKIKTFPVLVSSSPVSIVVSAPKEVNTNQSVDFSVEVTSNSPSLIKNVLLKVEYPFGFLFKNSSPKTFLKNNLWLVGDLEPGAKRVIKFSGIMNGQEGEERGFNFSIGSQSLSNKESIDVPFTSSFSSLTIRRPFVSADIFLEGSDAPEYISAAGSKVSGVIKWQNNLPYQVTDVSMVLKINGNAVDKSSVLVEGGFYQSIDGSVIFNKTTNRDFAILEPGVSGESKFSLSSFDVSSVTGSSLVNPTIVLDISVTGKRVGYTDGQQQDTLFSDSRKIKLTSNPQLFAKVLHYVGPFQNSGPVPPKAEQETTYTITWTITNPLNNLSGARVFATLPPYVKWLSAVSPDQEKINYDANTGQVTWNVGNIVSGAGSVASAREVSFQISLLPSVSQIGQVADLIGESTLTARDNFTSSVVSDVYLQLNTRLSSDPYFKVGGEIINK